MVAALRSHHHQHADDIRVAAYDLDFTDDDLRARFYPETVIASESLKFARITELGLPTHEDAPQPALKPVITFEVHWKPYFPKPEPQALNLRNGRTGEVVRTLTDGRLVVKVNCGLLYWEYYTPDEIKALNPSFTGGN